MTDKPKDLSAAMVMELWEVLERYRTEHGVTAPRALGCLAFMQHNLQHSILAANRAAQEKVKEEGEG